MMLNINKINTSWILSIRRSVLDFFSKYSIPKWIIFIMDNSAVVFFFFLAYLLRFNFDLENVDFTNVVSHLVLTLVVYLVFFLIFKPFSGLIRHTTLTDISLIFIVTSISAIALIILTVLSRIFTLGQQYNTPISIILIHYALVTIFLFFVRILIKILFRFATSSARMAKKVLIYGAGELGFIVKRVILSDPEYGFNVTGFIDEDKNLQGKNINGIPVYSPDILSKGYLSKNKIETLILAMKPVTLEKKSNIIHKAINLGLEVLDTPEVDKWLSGQKQTRKFQRVRLEDLLGRDPIKLNLGLIKEGLNNKVIMVTGAAGSIGSEMVRQLGRFSPKKVILVDQAETPMFNIESELKEKFIDLLFCFIIGDITNYQKMENIFRKYRPDVVFHAAAYKHVPLMETNPHEAIRVNVGGTEVLADLAIKYMVTKFVMISTDKSINPTSVMGSSKRICEKLVHSKSQQKAINTQFIITRFGNVLGSNGSVIPIFTKQIEKGGPVTVTHPDVKRYFMTIPEACELVLEAGFMGNGGEIFVFDMGEPIKIVELAEQMIKLSGLIPGEDIKIIFTGLRPGEKLYEELLTKKENTIPTHNPKIKKARVEEIDGAIFIKKVDKLMKNLYDLTENEICDCIKEMVPEYCSKNGHMNEPQ